MNDGRDDPHDNTSWKLCFTNGSWRVVEGEEVDGEGFKFDDIGSD